MSSSSMLPSMAPQSLFSMCKSLEEEASLSRHKKDDDHLDRLRDASWATTSTFVSSRWDDSSNREIPDDEEPALVTTLPPTRSNLLEPFENKNLLSWLPPDVCIHMGHYLKSADLCALSRVSRSWYQWLHHDAAAAPLWEGVALQDAHWKALVVAGDLEEPPKDHSTFPEELEQEASAVVSRFSKTTKQKQHVWINDLPSLRPNNSNFPNVPATVFPWSRLLSLSPSFYPSHVDESLFTPPPRWVRSTVLVQTRNTATDPSQQGHPQEQPQDPARRAQQEQAEESLAVAFNHGDDAAAATAGMITRRMIRMRRVPQPPVFQYVTVHDDENAAATRAIQLLGTVGTSNHCVRANRPFAIPSKVTTAPAPTVRLPPRGRVPHQQQHQDTAVRMSCCSPARRRRRAAPPPRGATAVADGPRAAGGRPVLRKARSTTNITGGGGNILSNIFSKSKRRRRGRSTSRIRGSLVVSPRRNRNDGVTNAVPVQQQQPQGNSNEEERRSDNRSVSSSFFRPFVLPFGIAPPKEDSLEDKGSSEPPSRTKTTTKAASSCKSANLSTWCVTPRLVHYFEAVIHTAPPVVRSNNTMIRLDQQQPVGAACIAIGVSTTDFDLHTRMPGWDDHSYGYHGDDGGIYHGGAQRMTRRYGPLFGQQEHQSNSGGDIVGCGIDYQRLGIFFTKNGKYLGMAFPLTRQQLESQAWFPTVGIDSACPVHCNFGQQPFAFDLQTYIGRHQLPVVEGTLVAPSQWNQPYWDMDRMVDDLVGPQQ